MTIRCSDKSIVQLLISVDVNHCTGSDMDNVIFLKRHLQSPFQMKDMGWVHERLFGDRSGIFQERLHTIST